MYTDAYYSCKNNSKISLVLVDWKESKTGWFTYLFVWLTGIHLEGNWSKAIVLKALRQYLDMQFILYMVQTRTSFSSSSFFLIVDEQYFLTKSVKDTFTIPSIVTIQRSL